MSEQNQTHFRQLNNPKSSFPDPNLLGEIREQVMELIERATGQRRVMVAHTLIVDFFERDHNAAILLNQILYWTARASDPNGWFYKTYRQWYEELRFSPYQVWRVVRGDPRVEKEKRTLWSLGLETQTRMAPNGRNAVFYRLNIPAFMTAFTEWLQHEHGLQPKQAKETEIRTRTNPRGRTSIFRQYERYFGKPTNRQRRNIWKQQHALGKARTQDIIETSQKTANNWSDVQQALERATFQMLESSSGSSNTVVQNNQEPSGFDRSDKGSVTPSAAVTPTVQQTWAQAAQMLRHHMRADYERLLGEHVLIDYQQENPEIFVIYVTSASASRTLSGRWQRFIRRYVSDSVGREVDVVFTNRQKWRHKPLE